METAGYMAPTTCPVKCGKGFVTSPSMACNVYADSAGVPLSSGGIP